MHVPVMDVHQANVSEIQNNIGESCVSAGSWIKIQGLSLLPKPAAFEQMVWHLAQRGTAPEVVGESEFAISYNKILKAQKHFWYTTLKSYLDYPINGIHSVSEFRQKFQDVAYDGECILNKNIHGIHKNRPGHLDWRQATEAGPSRTQIAGPSNVQSRTMQITNLFCQHIAPLDSHPDYDADLVSPILRQLKMQATEKPTIMLRIEEAIGSFFENSHNLVPRLSKKQIENLKLLNTPHEFLDFIWSTKAHEKDFQLFGTPNSAIKLFPEVDAVHRAFIFKCYSFLGDPISIIHMLNRITNFLTRSKLEPKQITFNSESTWIHLYQHVWFIVVNP